MFDLCIWLITCFPQVINSLGQVLLPQYLQCLTQCLAHNYFLDEWMNPQIPETMITGPQLARSGSWGRDGGSSRWKWQSNQDGRGWQSDLPGPAVGWWGTWQGTSVWWTAEDPAKGPQWHHHGPWGPACTEAKCIESSNKQNMCQCLRWEQGRQVKWERWTDTGGCSVASLGGNDNAYEVLF